MIESETGREMETHVGKQLAAALGLTTVRLLACVSAKVNGQGALLLKGRGAVGAGIRAFVGVNAVVALEV